MSISYIGLGPTRMSAAGAPTSLIRLDCCPTTLKLLSIIDQGPLLCNSFDDNLTYLSSISKFKTRFKAIPLKVCSSD